MPDETKPELEGRDVLLLRVGVWNGVNFNDAAFDGIKANTLKRGQDIVFAPSDDDTLPVHSLGRRGHGIIPIGSVYEKVSECGRELWGKLTRVSDWLKREAKQGLGAFVSPTIVGYASEEERTKEPGKGFIIANSPTPFPAMTPQVTWLAKEPGVAAVLTIPVNPDAEAQTATELAAKSARKAAAERVVKALKGKKGIKNPWAMTNWLKKHRPEAFKKIVTKARKKKRGA